MRDITQVLKLFANKYNMDYCRHFDRIRSALEYCNGHIKSFEKIHFRGGNETIFDDIISRLEEDLEGLNNIEDEHDLRKITFFLILNTDATFKYDLSSDQHICHIVNITPQIPKCLLLSIIWELKLQKFFYECMTYTPSWFSVQFIEPAVASMKNLEPYDVLEKVENLVIAIFSNACRSDFRQIDIVTKKIILNKFYDHTMELLRQFYTPDSEKFSDWSKREFFKYSGFAIRHILKMVLFCFDCLEFPLRRKVEEKYVVYEICTESSLVDETVHDGYSEPVRDILKKILMALLNTLQYNVMLVTIDVFMHWVEEDLADDLTLQADVGSYAYKVLERMAANKEFGHDVETHLKFISIRPRTLEETIKEANIGEILRKLDSDMDKKEKQQWLEELLSRPVVFENDECLETINLNANLLSYDNCVQIIDTVKSMQDYTLLEEMKGAGADECIAMMLTKALDNFKVDQLIELLLYEIRCFGKEVTVFQCDDLEQRCTSFSNKSTENIDAELFLRLCFENPNYIWQKTFSDAYTSQQQAKNFCSLALSVKKLSKLYLQDLLDKSFADKHEEKLYPYLLYEIYETQIIEKNAFFKDFIYTHVNKLLADESYKALLAIVKALSLIAHKTKSLPVFGGVTAPALVMIAQIMDQCRWDLVTYSDLNDEILRTAIECVQTTNKTFLPVVDGIVKEWITDKVKSLKPHTRYYFQKYSLPVTEKPKTFDEFLKIEPLPDNASAEKFLLANFVRCTMKETEWLGKSEILRPHISDVMLLLEGLVADMGDNALNNFRHSVMNYANIVKKIILPDLRSTKQAAELSMKILQIVKFSPKTLYADIFMDFHLILIEIIEKTKPLNDQEIQCVQNFTAKMAPCRGKEIFVQKFEESCVQK